ncbi:MAG: mechanosensitive ion channel family protein [Melioribacteraceae bacterium]|nr:mechanosensitive ion channel family protein [Melioribacteraceae bacterium]
MEILKTVFYGNSLQDYLISFGLIVIGIIILNLVKMLLFKLFAKKLSGNTWYEFIQKSIRKFMFPFLYLVIVYYAVSLLDIKENIQKILNTAYLIISTIFLIRLANAAISFLIRRYVAKIGKEDTSNRITPLTAFINFLIWVLGFLFILDNLGFQINTVITGLGIGGIAVALAAQAILGDLFSYFVIYFDKPFEIGDFVIFDDKRGTVEKIGIKTTKIRSITGEVLVVSNSNLTNARVHNYKQMQRRRVAFIIGVVYQTKLEKVKKIPAIIKEIVESNDDVAFDRSHFFNYGPHSLDFETVYFVEGNDYIKYMDIHQNINLKIYEAFEREGIEFAYPTQTLHINKNIKSSQDLLTN